MRLILTIFALVAAFPVGGAMADDECFVPMADWKPREAVAALATEQGWTVRRIKIDDGCYELDGTDAQGQRIEATIHPATLEILEIERGDDDDGQHHERKGDEKG
ncbi:hypothetical protein FHS85_001491 [Rhodoligotrophos appendicifer]|uniref:PepSY domain-containing protein n=1 Tax=Rhodoligotrophos appendicifer TaxID=987056 RepID=UPI001184A247|nr:PepSY domain-containing protein [Rhodoligotrophos appendicifer]